MANANDMIDITQGEFQQFVCQNTGGIGEAEETVICKESPQAHRTAVNDGFLAKIAETRVAVNDLDPFANDDIAEDREEGEDGRESGLPIYDKKGDMVDFEPIGQISNSLPSVVCMSDDDDLVATVDQFS